MPIRLFGKWIVVQVLAALKALQLFCAYLLCLPRKPPRPRQPFRFLELPPELRNTVYHHYFRHYWEWREFVEKYPDMLLELLYVSKQVREEASYVLYSRCVINIQITRSTNVEGGKVPWATTERMLSHFLRFSDFLKFSGKINLQICWPQANAGFPYDGGRVHQLSVAQIKRNIHKVCAFLATMPAIRTIQIELLLEDHWDYWKPVSLVEDLFLDLLKPLELVRRAHPEVKIQMYEDAQRPSFQWRELWPAGTRWAYEMVDDIIGNLVDWPEYEGLELRLRGGGAVE